MAPHILVPLDGSTLAEAALPHIVAVGRATGLPVKLLRLVDSSADEEHLSVPAGTWQRQVWVGHVAERLRQAGLNVRTTVTEGDPVRKILAYTAEPYGASLVAMATHGYHGVRRWLFGSVTEQVLHCSRVPVLAVRPGTKPPGTDGVYRTIVVALDGSPFAEQALTEAVPLARAIGATLHLVTVLPGQDDLADLDSAAAEAGVIPLWMYADRDADVRYLTGYLTSKQEALSGSGLRVRVEVVYGTPATAIVDASARQPASLLVMATHARSGMQRLWLGSVAQQALEHADGPVLLVHPADEPQRAAAAEIPREHAFVDGM